MHLLCGLLCDTRLVTFSITVAAINVKTRPRQDADVKRAEFPECMKKKLCSKLFQHHW